MTMYKNTEIDVYDILKGIGYKVYPEGKFVNANAPIPCLTYIKLIDAKQAWGDTQTFNTVGFTIKVWANKIEDLVDISFQVKEVLRANGFYTIDEAQDIYENKIIQRPLTAYALVRG